MCSVTDFRPAVGARLSLVPVWEADHHNCEHIHVSASNCYVIKENVRPGTLIGVVNERNEGAPLTN